MKNKQVDRLSEDDIWECYNSLLLSRDIERLRKLLVRYELFKMSLEVPGDIVECGVFKGAGLMYWLKLLKIFSPSSLKRVIGFDTFKSFAPSLRNYEKASAYAYVKEAKFKGINPKDILKCAESVSLKEKVELIEGDLQKTARQYIKRNPGLRISLLHLDVDTYFGTKSVLEHFYPVVSRGGIIILDEYGCRGWGETDAVDEFFSRKKIKIKTVPFSVKPTAYIIKS